MPVRRSLTGSQSSSLTLLSPLIFLKVPSHMILDFLLGSTKLNQYRTLYMTAYGYFFIYFFLVVLVIV
jgi:hypothetical protein